MNPTKAILEIPGFGEKMVRYVGGTKYVMNVGLGNPPSYAQLIFEIYKMEDVLGESMMFMRLSDAEKKQ